MNIEVIQKQIVNSSPDVMGGTLVFSGGSSIDDFLDGFPTVSKKQIIDFLDKMEQKVTEEIL